ncbi:alpha-glucan water dikinase, chloroplastic-like [Dorcoceras hygrometricum]|uniref:Alpha-glucan water dikinase, chloroplastic-like n=1 Tax=Dorcoceras hygrometricum TaxID=472368 RepID=A0A2Z7A9S0_9LAMI|nr:alpha-glucan water dikinase, chloroplastic-like [Dorcoceras hygrometricum]
MDQENKQVRQWILTRTNRTKLVKDKPARTKEDQLGEKKTGSEDLVKMDAYERDEAAGRMIYGRTEQEQLCTRADDKSKLEISSRAVVNKTSRVEEATSSKKRPAQFKAERKQAGKLVKVKPAQIAYQQML